MGKSPIFIIAELCSNAWPYDEERLRMFCEVGHAAGADAAKIQLFWAKHFGLAEWPEKERLKFPRGRVYDFIAIARHCELKAGASVFDVPAVQDCASHRVDFIKIATREMENQVLIRAAAASGLAMYQSFPWDVRGGNLRRLAISHFVPLACQPGYPSPGLDRQDILALRNLEKPWGWSSHTGTGVDCVMAAQAGACVIEAHLALSKDDPEAGHSLLPQEFAAMVAAAREV